MTTQGASIRLLAAVALTELAALSASAQTITDPNKKIGAPGTTAKPTTAKPAGTATAAGKTSAKPKLSDQTSTDYWAINTDLGKYSRDSKPSPSERTPLLSRQPLKGADGSIGLTAGDVRPATLGNGTVAAGMERYNQTPDSYAGMSLSISSPDKNFPLLPRNSSW